MIQTCKLNGVEPLAYLTDIPQRIVSGRTKNHELHECCRGTGVRHPQSPPRNPSLRQPASPSRRRVNRSGQGCRRAAYE
ncbi:MAG: transposase domain-containing protein [Acetobacteraceae bacterium]